MKRALIIIFFMTGTFYFLITLITRSKYPNMISQKIISSKSNVSEVDIAKSDTSVSENIQVKEVEYDIESDIAKLQQAAAEERVLLKKIEESNKFNYNWYASTEALTIINTPVVQIINDIEGDECRLRKEEFLVYLCDEEDKAKFEIYMKTVLDGKKEILNKNCNTKYEYTVKNIAVNCKYLADLTAKNKNIYSYSVRWEKSSQNT